MVFGGHGSGIWVFFVFWTRVFELAWYGARGLIVMGFDMLSRV